MEREIRPIGTLESAAICWGVAALVGVAGFALLLLIGDWSLLQAAFAAIVLVAVLGTLLAVTLGRPLAAPTTVSGRMQHPTETRSRADEPGHPGEPAMPRPADDADTHAASPHRTEIPRSMISTPGDGPALGDPNTNKSISPGPGGTPAAEAAPTTRIPGPAPINAADPFVARPVGATTAPRPMMQPTPLSGAVVSPEPPVPLVGEPERIGRNETAPTGGARPAPTATPEAQSYNEVDPVRPGVAGGAAGAAASDGAQAMPVAGGARTGGRETTAGSAGGDTVADGTPVAARTAPAADAGRPSRPEPKVTPTVDAAPAPGAAFPERDGGDAGETGRHEAAPSASTGGATDADADVGRKPETLAAPRGEGPDDLKQIKGVGPKLEGVLNDMGFYHFAQIAAWTDEEVAWVDANLEGFRGRVSRDEWVDQARTLADGGEAAFSGRVDQGGVY